jgi:tetratricopeptide (TPR) repeat protein
MYEQLHADYTARAAAVLRQLRDGLDVGLPEAPKPRGARRWLPAAAIVAFAVTAAILLAQSAGTRQPGGSLTGNDPNTTVNAQQRKTTLAKAVQDHPDDYNARLAYARFLLNGDPQQAVEQYDAAAKLAPKQPEPLAYGGWIRALVAGQLQPGQDRDLLVQSAMTRFTRAIEVAPNYADSFVFRGITRMRLTADTDGAIADFRRFLQLAPPDHPERELVLGALRDAVAATSTTVPPNTQP